MKKNNFTLCLFVLLGLLAGTIVGQLLSSVGGLSFLAKSAEFGWEPKADLQVIQYDLNLHFRLNIVSILGAVIAVWLYRRL